ncbi:MAG: winged helix-turn-helix transcriptional regulator [Candidatus Aenigmarchaeota archaeon]|nr:winged helix-turn-helix transcriptional regulator [Candidatus Aenigmarchaeota archaeon]
MARGVFTFAAIFRDNYAKVLDFFIDNPRYDFTVTEIARHTKISRITVTKIISNFNKDGIIKKSRKLGRGQLYIFNTDNPIVKIIMRAEFEMISVLAEQEQKIQQPMKIPVRMKR